MKKQTPSTFILNANDVSYFFVEGKHSSIYGPLYCVYYNSKTKPVKYSAKNFVKVHGLNDKEAIVKFTRQALLDLTVLHGSDPRVENIYDIFHKVYILTQSQDLKRPKLGKLKNTFIDAVATYNELKELLPANPEISYEEDYLLVTGEKKKIKQVEKAITEPVSERKIVKQIVSGYEDTKAVQRKLKYD